MTTNQEHLKVKPNGAPPPDVADIAELWTDTGGRDPLFENLADHREPETGTPASVFSDLNDHLLDPGDEDDVAEELLTTVPIRRPSKKDFIRCHGDHQFTVVIYEDDETGDTYYVHPNMRRELTEEDGAKRVTLVLYMNRRKTLCFWPVTTSGMGKWRQTAMAAVEHAKTRWVKVVPDKAYGGYRVKPALADYGEPDWGPHTLNQLLELAFVGLVIDNPDHLVAKHALGRPG
jgi:hypothetical protein